MATKTETISIKVSPEEKAKIKELAAAQDTTVSKFTTIAQYATRLESIQEDVKDIKMDMTTIKAKVDK